MIGTRFSTRSGFATVAAIATVAAVPAPASAAVSGSTTLVLSGPAAKALRAAGVQAAPLKPAKGSERRIVLPVRAGLAGAGTTILTHRGGISLSRRGTTARLSKLRLLLGKKSRLSATIGGRSVDVFALGGGGRSVDPQAGTVQLGGAKLKLTRAGARAIAAALDPAGAGDRRQGTRAQSPLEVRQGHFGGIAARAAGLAAAGGSPGSGGGAQASTGCPSPSGAGPAGEDTPPVATRPPGAADIAGATIDWHVRESFIRYIATGEGTSVSGGATADPPVLLPGASTPLTYDFHFPFASGWHDGGANPADPADDTAAVYLGGAIRFLYSGHEIDLTTSSPEIEIAGGSSRAIFTVTEGAGAPARQVLVNLDLSRAAAISAGGNAYTYERVPGAIPSGTASTVFGGFYAPGTEFGCFTVRYTTS